MVRYHGIKIHGPVRKPAGGIDTSNRPMPVWVLARAIEAAEKGMGPEDARYYLAEESLKLLEPRPGDITEEPSSNSAGKITVRQRDADVLMKAGLLKIIQRNGVAFMWPETEDV